MNPSRMLTIKVLPILERVTLMKAPIIRDSWKCAVIIDVLDKSVFHGNIIVSDYFVPKSMDKSSLKW